MLYTSYKYKQSKLKYTRYFKFLIDCNYRRYQQLKKINRTVLFRIQQSMAPPEIRRAKCCDQVPSFSARSRPTMARCWWRIFFSNCWRNHSPLPVLRGRGCHTFTSETTECQLIWGRLKQGTFGKLNRVATEDKHFLNGTSIIAVKLGCFVSE